MADQAFSATEREAIWLAWTRKCGYTREPLDVSDFHIDHIVPEHVADNAEEFARVKVQLSLPDAFDVRSYYNLIPCRSRANLQKGGITFDANRTNFFLGVAAEKVAAIERHKAEIDRRNIRGKAIILLQQCLERQEISTDEVLAILDRNTAHPEEIFPLLLGLKYADENEVDAICRSDIDELLDRPIWLGSGGPQEGVNLPNAAGVRVNVRTCNEYKAAIAAGHFAYSTFEISMATWFELQLGLLTSLKNAKSPSSSFVSSPLRGVVDLDLLPYSLFPVFDQPEDDSHSNQTYQAKVDDGTLVVRKVANGHLRIESADGMGQNLIEVARADFTGDGHEELLVFDSFYATKGVNAWGNGSHTFKSLIYKFVCIPCRR
jgi:hypothetical protein